MGDDQLVALGHRCQGLGGHPHVGPLVLRGHGLAPLQQGVAAEGYEDSHGRSAPERGHEQRLDGVEAVLRLVEDDGGLGLEDVVGDLEGVQAELLEDLLAEGRLAVVEGGQAVHEPHQRVAGAFDQRGVDLVGPQLLDPLGPPLLGLAHGQPDVGVDEVDARDTLGDVVGVGDAGAGRGRDPGREQISR